MTLRLDPNRARIRIRTFAEGLLSRLAHDLELTCRDVTGTAEDRANDAGTARLEVPVAKIDVAGTLKNGVVDPNGLSASDREDCLTKMRREVFQAKGASDVVRIEVDVDDGRARIRVIPPNGKAVERIVPLRPSKDDDGAVKATGTVDVSLNAIGSLPVKGPMNAFRVKDRVEVLFDVAFVPDQPA
ncbi:MAG: hypothetical protein KIT84_17260 [Labilithrix sp.]|nr:hypothetical protein [Labilithrix sp.]MCW5812780.1 hypothetical protein [Labilithrix sp.]